MQQLVDGLAAAVGVEGLEFERGDKLPRQTLDRVQQSVTSMIGDPQEIANLVLYIVTQPIDIGLDEVIIRPGKNLPM